MTAPDRPANPAEAPRWVAAAFLFTGAGLIAHILFDVPLPLSVVGFLVAGAVVVVAFVGAGAAGAVLPLVGVGLASGALATVAYDASRVAFVELTGSPVAPFEAWRLFGAALIGAETAATWQWVAGTAFHLTNGLLFAVAFVVLLRDRGVPAGIVWALVLEAFMLALYPGWIEIRAFSEFVQVSVLGHVVYGAVLGAVSQRLLRRGAGASG